MIKAMPIFFYPFLNTQNQLKLDDAYLQASTPSTDVNTSLHYQLNYLLGGLAMANTDTQIFTGSPKVNVGLSLGSIYFKISLSKDSFNPDYFDVAKGNRTIENINFIYFYDDTYGSNQINKWFYFVEDRRQLNPLLWEFTLSLDVLKTYNQYIKLFKNVNPIRYFEFDFFNQSASAQMTNANFTDPLIQYPTEANIKINLTHPVKNSDDTLEFSGLWIYFYMTITNNNTPKFYGQNFMIIALPYMLKSNNTLMSYYNDIISALKSAPQLIKALVSDIPPTNNVFTLNMGTGAQEISTFDFVYDFDSTVSDTYGTLFSLSTNTGQAWAKVYDESDYLKIYRLKDIDTNLTTYLSALTGYSNISDLSVFVQQRQNPNNAEKDNRLYLVHRNVYGLPYYVVDVLNGTYISRSTLTALISDYGERTASDIDKFMLPVQFGYKDNTKVFYPKNNQKNDSDMKLLLTSYIVHALVDTKEIVKPIPLSNLYNYSELYAKRSNELSITSTTDNYANYIYLNKNALAQKTKQLNKYNDMSTIASTGISLVGAIGGTIATGGAMTPVLIGATIGAFNMVQNLFQNEMQRQQFASQMSDKKLQPLTFENGNFNEFSDDVLYFLPVLEFFSDYRYKYDFQTLPSTLTANNLRNIIKWYGYYTPLTIEMTFGSLFTRTQYNYIQIRSTDRITNVKGIPNDHFKAILTILENGVRYWSRAYIQDHTIDNIEVI